MRRVPNAVGARRTEPRRAWRRALVAAACCVVVLCVGLGGLAREALTPWQQRMRQRVSPTEIRLVCDQLMDDQRTHATYRPEGSFSGHPTIDVLPAVISSMKPDKVTVEPNEVRLVWHGDIMTSFGLVVFRVEPQDVASKLIKNFESLGPRVWIYVD